MIGKLIPTPDFVPGPRDQVKGAYRGSAAPERGRRPSGGAAEPLLRAGKGSSRNRAGVSKGFPSAAARSGDGARPGLEKSTGREI